MNGFSLALASLVLSPLACSSGNPSVATLAEDAAVEVSQRLGGSTDAAPEAADAPDAPDDTARVCWIVQSSDAAVRRCHDCSAIMCAAERRAAYGATSQSGAFSGACRDYAACACSCDERDVTCGQACVIGAARECRDALNAIDRCEHDRCAAECNPS